MFNRTTHQIKDFEVVTYEHLPSGVAISLIPKFGALIQRLVLALKDRTFDVLDVPEVDEIPDNPIYKSSLLAPYPNRVDAGRYQFEGKDHQLPINEKDRNNAIHGFICNYPFEMVSETMGTDAVSVTLRNSYSGNFPGYPYPFITEVRITLSPLNGLECTCSFLNSGTGPLPLGFAWHPYFTLDSPVDELELKLPVCNLNEVTDRLIPTGAIRPFRDFETSRSIGDRFIDYCFSITDTGPTAETIIRNPSQDFAVRVWQETGDGKLTHLVVYTPPGRKALAIEPQTCNINAFNNGQGLIILEEGKKAEARFGVSLLA